jgi:hypothetical protein
MSSKKSRPQIELKKGNIDGSTQSRYDREAEETNQGQKFG